MPKEELLHKIRKEPVSFKSARWKKITKEGGSTVLFRLECGLLTGRYHRHADYERAVFSSSRRRVRFGHDSGTNTRCSVGRSRGNSSKSNLAAVPVIPVVIVAVSVVVVVVVGGSSWS